MTQSQMTVTVLDLDSWKDIKDILLLLRKEVIQPQVPLRLPCYDLVPIISLIFGGSVLIELG